MFAGPVLARIPIDRFDPSADPREVSECLKDCFPQVHNVNKEWASIRVFFFRDRQVRRMLSRGMRRMGSDALSLLDATWEVDVGRRVPWTIVGKGGIFDHQYVIWCDGNELFLRLVCFSIAFKRRFLAVGMEGPNLLFPLPIWAGDGKNAGYLVFPAAPKFVLRLDGPACLCVEDESQRRMAWQLAERVPKPPPPLVMFLDGAFVVVAARCLLLRFTWMAATVLK